MTSTAISRLFDAVLQLEEDETIILKFGSLEELKVKKTQLFREKAKYEKSVKAVAKGIAIRQDVRKLRLMISTSGTKLDWLNDAVVTSKGGERKLFEQVKDERLEKLRQQEMKDTM